MNNAVNDSGFFSLSDEMVLHCFSYLGPQDLSRVAQCSIRLNCLSSDNSLWKRLHQRLWKIQLDTCLPKNWKQHYILGRDHSNMTSWLELWKKQLIPEAFHYAKIQKESPLSSQLHIAYRLILVYENKKAFDLLHFIQRQLNADLENANRAFTHCLSKDCSYDNDPLFLNKYGTSLRVDELAKDFQLGPRFIRGRFLTQARSHYLEGKTSEARGIKDKTLNLLLPKAEKAQLELLNTWKLIRARKFYQAKRVFEKHKSILHSEVPFQAWWLLKDYSHKLGKVEDFLKKAQTSDLLAQYSKLKAAIFYICDQRRAPNNAMSLLNSIKNKVLPAIIRMPDNSISESNFVERYIMPLELKILEQKPVLERYELAIERMHQSGKHGLLAIAMDFAFLAQESAYKQSRCNQVTCELATFFLHYSNESSNEKLKHMQIIFKCVKKDKSLYTYFVDAFCSYNLILKPNIKTLNKAVKLYSELTEPLPTALIEIASLTKALEAKAHYKQLIDWIGEAIDCKQSNRIRLTDLISCQLSFLRETFDFVKAHHAIDYILKLQAIDLSDEEWFEEFEVIQNLNEQSEGLLAEKLKVRHQSDPIIPLFQALHALNCDLVEEACLLLEPVIDKIDKIYLKQIKLLGYKNRKIRMLYTQALTSGQAREYLVECTDYLDISRDKQQWNKDYRSFQVEDSFLDAPSLDDL